MSNQMRTGIRERLEDERRRLLDDIAALDAENQLQQEDSGVGNHMADDASDVMNRERNFALRGNAEELLAHVDVALKRLAAGTYGQCARCGNPINPERLEALPYAAYCITCQSEVERAR
ncbi:MAG: TraR/DksA C4-type zinc finger protein [Kouleothrix sp.]|jgi:RNA polymerase-binding protein DksA|nr:TraR/DksA C4-type zinc finger protein [Kouleothrix sp.]